MPKKSDSRGARNESSSSQGRPAKQDRQQARQEGNSGAGQGRQQGNSGVGQGARQDVGEQRQENRQRQRDAGDQTKKGCFPKLFMLLLPFIAVGTYFLVRS